MKKKKVETSVCFYAKRSKDSTHLIILEKRSEKFEIKKKIINSQFVMWQ